MKIYEYYNINIDKSSDTTKYNIDTSGYAKEEFTMPLSLDRFHNMYIGEKTKPTCLEAYSEINNYNNE